MLFIIIQCVYEHTVFGFVFPLERIITYKCPGEFFFMGIQTGLPPPHGSGIKLRLHVTGLIWGLMLIQTGLLRHHTVQELN